MKQPQVARWESNEYRTASLERLDEVARALGEDLSSLAPPEIAAEVRAPYAPIGPLPPRPSEADPLTRLDVDLPALASVCRRHHVAELALFGSVLRPDFTAKSDVDVLIRFDERCHPGFAVLIDLQDDLAALFGRSVDLAERTAIESSENYIRRRRILSDARTVYVA